MGWLTGALKIADAERATVNNVGQALVYEEAKKYLAWHSADLEKQRAVFVQGVTDKYLIKYKLPGGGRLQRRGGQAVSGAVKPSGSWDVGFPLEDFGAQYALTDVDMAYMTIAQLELAVDNIRIQDMNTVRYEVLRALLNNTARSYVDETIPDAATVTVKPLANNDTDVYPTVIGSETETTENHYLTSGFVGADIDDTNNPFKIARDELEEHFGTPTGYGNIAVFTNGDFNDEIEALSNFKEVEDIHIRSGQDVSVPVNLPLVPGRILGRCGGVWVVQWKYVPATYMLAVDLGAGAPLMERRDPAFTGLGTGLQLVSKDKHAPFESAHYRHRVGFGVANRLNGVALELTADASYDIPADYA